MKTGSVGLKAVVAALTLVRSAADAQFELSSRPRDLVLEFLREYSSAEALPRATLEPNAEVEGLFSRARDAADRQDFKLAVDCLQRIIEMPQPGLVNIDTDATSVPEAAAASGRLAESARVRALRELSALPVAARDVYELLYGPIARRLVEAAVRDFDVAALERVVSDYPHTSAAVEAFDRLIALKLDEGAAAEALALLDDLAAYRPESANLSRTRFRRAVGLGLLGREREALELLAGIASDGERAPLTADTLTRIRKHRTMDGSTDYEASIHRADFSLMGDMPDYTAKVDQSPVWRFLTAERNRRVWSHVLMAREAWELPLPLVPSLALNGDVLYVRTTEGCAALDTANLAPRWVWRAPASSAAPTWGGMSDAAGLMLTWVTRWQADYIGSCVSVTDDHVFVIQRQPTWNLAFQSIFRWQFGMQPQESEDSILTDLLGGDPVRFVALDARTGREAWSLDGSASTGPFAQARFLGPPLVVDRHIWLPVSQGRDLACAVVDPNDGQLVDRIHLCSVSTLGQPRGRALYLAERGNHVLIQTGYGLLMCVDAASRKPRWASRYNDGDYTIWQQRTDQLEGRMGWLPSPPVIAGDVVLNAPVDFNALLAHDLRTGAIRWQVPVGAHQYIIAADAVSFWLGGGTVSRLSLLDGRTLWTSSAPSSGHSDRRGIDHPIGRIIKCGQRLIIPQASGLTFLSAETGDVLETTSVLERPPGTIVSLGESLLSVDPDQVRLFTDMARAMHLARNRAAADPGDVDASLRLAWMEWLAGDARAAWERTEHLTAKMTDKFPSDPSSSATGAPNSLAGSRMDSWSRLRKACVLELSRQSDTPSTRLELATKALELADSEADAREAAWALAEAQLAAGQGLHAFQTAWNACTAHETSGAHRSSSSASLAGSNRQRLSRLLAGMDDGVRQQGRLWAEKVASDAAARAERARRITIASEVSEAERDLAQMELGSTLTQLENIARLRLRDTGSAVACLILGHIARTERRFEAAEQAFLTAQGLEESPRVTAEALIGLCELYQSDLPQPVLCRQTLMALNQRFAAMPVPSGDGRTTVGDWVRRSQSEWRTFLASAPADQGPLRVMREGEAHVFGASEDVQMLRAGHHGADAQWNAVVFLAEGRRLIARRLDNAAAVWSTDLRMPGRFRSEWSEEREPDAWLTWDGDARGTVLIAVNRDGFHAVGALSGKRLWSCPFDLPPLETSMTTAAGWRLAVAGPQGVACLRSWNTIAMLDPMDGQEVWRTEVPDVLVGLRRKSAHILASNHDLSRLYAFDAATGELLGHTIFRPSDGETPALSPLVFDDYVVGRIAAPTSNTVAAFLHGSGEPVWSFQRPTIRNIFDVSDTEVLIVQSDRRLTLIDVASGEIIFDVAFPGEVIKDSFIMEGVLAVLHDPRPESANYAMLTALDRRQGSVLWTQPGVILTSIPKDVWQRFGETIPLLTEVDDPRRRQYNPVVLTTLDVHSGKPVGSPLVLLPKDSRERPTGQMEMRSGRLLVMTTAGIRVFDVGPVEEQAKSKR